VHAITAADVVAGYCWIELRETSLHIHALILLPGQRGRGVGRAALGAIEEKFRGRFTLLELGVAATNSGARRLYRRCGYRTEQLLPELGYEIMRKRIGPEDPSA
jgi:ribosomal protein S18 acetylase RimI-like enzyme